jgi:hypothetical protein
LICRKKTEDPKLLATENVPLENTHQYAFNQTASVLHYSIKKIYQKKKQSTPISGRITIMIECIYNSPLGIVAVIEL